MLDSVDEVITYDVPWIKTVNTSGPESLYHLVDILKKKQFDAAVIFTVFSQNPLPAALTTYLAGIPQRMAYCRENPYELLTHWVPDKEPYSMIRHQVERDLYLASQTGACIKHKEITLMVEEEWKLNATKKLRSLGLRTEEPWIILHPGVSEKKRQYPADKWISIGKRLTKEQGLQLIITGTATEKSLCQSIASGIEHRAINAAGIFSLKEFTALVKMSSLVLSVNTGTVHIASAVQTPVIVLYAMTNPQHTPWMVENKVFHFPVEPGLRSSNEVLKFLQQQYDDVEIEWPDETKIVEAALEMLREEHASLR